MAQARDEEVILISLHTAIAEHDMATMERLVKEGADVNAMCRFEALVSAKASRSRPTADGKESGAKKEEKGKDKKKEKEKSKSKGKGKGQGKEKETEAEKDKGTSIKRYAGEPKPALHRAVSHGNLAAMEFLIAHGADLLAESGDGRSVFYDAATSDDVKSTELLVKHGLSISFDINFQDRHGDTPLHEAAYQGNLAAMEFLSQHGADLLAIGASGRTAIRLYQMHKQPPQQQD
jgi:hypothetical protein